MSSIILKQKTKTYNIEESFKLCYKPGMKNKEIPQSKIIKGMLPGR
ncbi:hypothetical protein ES708_10367 [subsurface metagenome]